MLLATEQNSRKNKNKYKNPKHTEPHRKCANIEPVVVFAQPLARLLLATLLHLHVSWPAEITMQNLKASSMLLARFIDD